METQTHFYFLFFIGIALVLSVVTVRLSLFLSKLCVRDDASDEQKEAFAGGFSELSSPEHSFTVRFFLAALFFVLLTAEFLLLLPWIVSFRIYGVNAAIAVGIFVLFCVAGGFFEYKRGAF